MSLFIALVYTPIDITRWMILIRTHWTLEIEHWIQIRSLSDWLGAREQSAHGPNNRPDWPNRHLTSQTRTHMHTSLSSVRPSVQFMFVCWKKRKLNTSSSPTKNRRIRHARQNPNFLWFPLNFLIPFFARIYICRRIFLSLNLLRAIRIKNILFLLFSVFPFSISISGQTHIYI